MISDANSQDDLDQQWASVEQVLNALPQLIAPIHTAVQLRPLRNAIALLARATEQRNTIATEPRFKAGLTRQEVISQWKTLRHSSPETDFTGVVRGIVGLPVPELVHHPKVTEVIGGKPDIFCTKPWLRRFYTFFFDTLYQQEPADTSRTWARLVATTAGALASQPLRPRYQVLVASVARFFSLSDGFDEGAFEAHLDQLLSHAPSEAMASVDTLGHYYREQLGFVSLPYGIRLYCQRRLFDIRLTQYLGNKTNTGLLMDLLKGFCPLDAPSGREHFLQLVNEAFGGSQALQSLSGPRKTCIKSWLLACDTVGDPRMGKAAWFSLKDEALDVYRALRFWFVAADFEFFFEFAFKNSPDDHARKELWMKFLKQAHDFRVFLPAASYREYLATVKDENRHAQVYKNRDDVTGFILCVSDLVIYEAVETGNSAYIYDRNTLQKETSRQGKTAKVFLETLLDNNEIPEHGTKTGLAHTVLAPSQLETDYRRIKKNKRFTHDRNKFWHQQVLEFLRTEHFIHPDSKA